MRVAFLGLGVMGYPMAGHLAAAGHEVTVYNRSTEKARVWTAEYGGQLGLTPCEAVQQAEIVFICVGNDDDLRSVVFGGQGALAGMEAGSVLVDHTTVSANVAREVATAAAALQLGFLDAPVSGGQAGAENGVLTVMVGGDSEVFERAEAIMGAFAQRIRLMGSVGSGQLTKMVNQICIAGLLQGLSEGVHFARQAGLDSAAVFDVLSRGAAQSWQMENRVETMADDTYAFGFAVDWMRKDLGIVLDEGRRNGSQLPVTALVDSFYSDVQRMGGGRWDTSSLLARLQPVAKASGCEGGSE